MQEPINQINSVQNYNVQLGTNHQVSVTKEVIINAKNGCCFLPLNIFLFFVGIGGAVGCGLAFYGVIMGIGIPFV